VLRAWGAGRLLQDSLQTRLGLRDTRKRLCRLVILCTLEGSLINHTTNREIRLRKLIIAMKKTYYLLECTSVDASGAVLRITTPEPSAQVRKTFMAYELLEVL
jgi:hypothetical protein